MNLEPFTLSEEYQYRILKESPPRNRPGKSKPDKPVKRKPKISMISNLKRKIRWKTAKEKGAG